MKSKRICVKQWLTVHLSGISSDYVLGSVNNILDEWENDLTNHFIKYMIIYYSVTVITVFIILICCLFQVILYVLWIM